jgi:hypothetical protein
MVNAMLEQLERLELAIDAGGDGLTLDFGLRDAPDSAMARFAAAQQPASFSYASWLPPGAAGALFAGALNMRPFADRMAAWVASLMGGDVGPWARTSALWLELSTGELAMAVNVPLSPDGASEVAVTMAVGVTDAGRARDLMREVSAAGNTGYVHYQRVGTPAFRIGGVEVDEWNMTVDLDAAPEAQRDALAKLYAGGISMMYAPIAETLVVASGKRSRTEIEAVLAAAAAARKQVAHPELATAIAEARARRESALMLLDLAAVSPGAGWVMGLGFEAPASRLRLSITSAQLRALVAGMP